MINRNAYFYKGYDVDSNSKQEKKQIEYMNPYGYNLESSCRRNRKINTNDVLKTNQDELYPVLKKKR